MARRGWQAARVMTAGVAVMVTLACSSAGHRGPSLPVHMERVLRRLTSARATGTRSGIVNVTALSDRKVEDDASAVTGRVLGPLQITVEDPHNRVAGQVLEHGIDHHAVLPRFPR